MNYYADLVARISNLPAIQIKLTWLVMVGSYPTYMLIGVDNMEINQIYYVPLFLR